MVDSNETGKIGKYEIYDFRHLVKEYQGECILIASRKYSNEIKQILDQIEAEYKIHFNILKIN